MINIKIYKKKSKLTNRHDMPCFSLLSRQKIDNLCCSFAGMAYRVAQSYYIILGQTIYDRSIFIGEKEQASEMFRRSVLLIIYIYGYNMPQHPTIYANWYAIATYGLITIRQFLARMCSIEVRLGRHGESNSTIFLAASSYVPNRAGLNHLLHTCKQQWYGNLQANETMVDRSVEWLQLGCSHSPMSANRPLSLHL